MSFKGEPETERVVTTPGQTVISLGLRLVEKKTTSSGLWGKVATNYLEVGEETTCFVGYNFRDLLGNLLRGAVSRPVSTVAKLRAAGILARAVSLGLAGALAGDQPQPQEQDQAELSTIQTCSSLSQ